MPLRVILAASSLLSLASHFMASLSAWCLAVMVTEYSRQCKHRGTPGGRGGMLKRVMSTYGMLPNLLAISIVTNAAVGIFLVVVGHLMAVFLAERRSWAPLSGEAAEGLLWLVFLVSVQCTGA